MLRSCSAKLLSRSTSLSRNHARNISSSLVAYSQHPNAPVELDPSYKSLLEDVDLSLLRHKARHGALDPVRPAPVPRELEVFPSSPLEDYMTSEELDDHEVGHQSREKQKSPAALFGSQQIGAVVLPFELQQTISRLISDSDKPRLHADAKRLFSDGDEDAEWDTSYDVRYKSRQQSARHEERDGTAFASVALPAHYSAISSVFNHLKQRLGPNWTVDRVLDWGSGAGSGLWAASHAFQKAAISVSTDSHIANTTVHTYIGIDKRMGLVNVAKRLTQGVELGDLTTLWQKAFHEEDKVERGAGKNTIALSAFLLSSLPTPLARKSLVKEMWESGAEVIVLMDHSTTAGFECIAEARENFLRFGRREMEDPSTTEWPIRGSHVVAPCPHDRACPLHHPGSTQLVCGFSQRLQRPDFVRKTKHSGIGHEDVEYSYVVIRRGVRPTATLSKVGRVGEIGKRELVKAQAKDQLMTELFIDDGHHTSVRVQNPDVPEATEPTASFEGVQSSDKAVATDNLAGEELQEALRAEAYSWPRLVFPPLKKAGHIILDGCTAEGKIMRMTIPKSQGKQPFYDARKSTWGDIFPHDPKNAPQERYQPKRAGDAKTVPLKGADIGKRSNERKNNNKASYGSLANGLKEERRRKRKQRRESADDGDHDDYALAL